MPARRSRKMERTPIHVGPGSVISNVELWDLFEVAGRIQRIAASTLYSPHRSSLNRKVLIARAEESVYPALATCH